MLYRAKLSEPFLAESTSGDNIRTKLERSRGGERGEEERPLQQQWLGGAEGVEVFSVGVPGHADARQISARSIYKYLSMAPAI